MLGSKISHPISSASPLFSLTPSSSFPLYHVCRWRKRRVRAQSPSQRALESTLLSSAVKSLTQVKIVHVSMCLLSSVHVHVHVPCALVHVLCISTVVCLYLHCTMWGTFPVVTWFSGVTYLTIRTERKVWLCWEYVVPTTWLLSQVKIVRFGVNKYLPTVSVTCSGDCREKGTLFNTL